MKIYLKITYNLHKNTVKIVKSQHLVNLVKSFNMNPFM